MKKSIELTFTNNRPDDFSESWTIKAVNENGFDKINIYRDSSGQTREWTVLSAPILWDEPGHVEPQLTDILYSNIREIVRDMGVADDKWVNYITPFHFPFVPE